ncbi:hypothetical protein [Streptomyces sp. AP-93]|uniref:hypothetical protein n=1 Tax=Streptomyces sp. AP-93 TaxID=2929048 RepID=UPI001FAFA46C|nr:hypothetical protein [Streptomyces sp. AP-93]MCJ0875677.1 hypothetical protein [Streptomyces sp. AP-93]
MIATPERIREDGGRTEVTVWHKPVGRVLEEFQAIACSDTEGVTLPAPRQDVPLVLDQPDQRWCTDCLTVIHNGRK